MYHVLRTRTLFHRVPTRGSLKNGSLRKLGRLAAGIALLGGLALGCSRHKDSGQSTPPDDPVACGKLDEQPLAEPPVIPYQGGELSTELVIRERRHDCVPVFDSDQNAWVGQTMVLRTYGWPKTYGTPIDPENPDDPNTVWGFPGPTFVLEKASAEGAGDGTAFNMELYNRMTPNTADDATCRQDQGPGVEDMYPNCFHGDNTTNFHFHGFHVSPQPHQDYVLLALRPKGSTTEAMAMGRGLMVDSGNYSYALDPLIWQQAEGTHWYHPHKHGSTALQVLNGMAGTFKILGPFDEWLDSQFAQPLADKVMVLQQLGEDVLFYEPGATPPSVVVNGQPTPVVTMNQGEIQRWRFIGATMQASAQLAISFKPDTAVGLEVKQIAQDGVRFAAESYQSQPLLTGGTAEFQLAPGNRADFLVRAPEAAGRYALTQRVFANLPDNVRQLIETSRQRVRGRNARATADGAPLLYVDVTEVEQSMTFPQTADWPPMPDYLQDITSVDGNRTVEFEMTGSPGNQPNSFQIDGKPYDPDCADQTLTLGQAEEWAITNNSAPLHPFHIHINPFQVRSRGDGTLLDPPWIWQDTIALPQTTVATATPVTIRQRYDNFTGEFVLHCHFLGHEDRGMMQNVQTVCPENDQYGSPRAGQPECVAGNYVPDSPAPSCTP